MSDALKKVQSGQKLHIPAQAYNAFIDAAVDYRRRTAHLGRKPTSTSQQQQTILVRNDSGADVGRFAVLGIDQPIIAPSVNLAAFTQRVTLACTAPATGVHEGRLVITAEPIAAGKIGRTTVVGIAPVRLDVPDSAAEAFRRADPADGLTTHLQAHANGSTPILWREGGTGLQWALANLAPPTPSMLPEPVDTSIVYALLWNPTTQAWEAVPATDDCEAV